MELENLKKQRQEFENSFNQEFIVWFFEKYLANSAEDWEQASSGIYELYWRDVESSKQIAERMKCLGIQEMPKLNLINVTYDTEYGSIEFWEEIKTVKWENDKEVQMLTPHMKIWIFPPKEFLIYEMKEAMNNHEFPGSPEEKLERANEDGLTLKEVEMIRQDNGFMDQIKKLSEKYEGSMDVSVQFKDYTSNETVFNLYVQINEEDIANIKPMLPEELPSTDVNIDVDFNSVYNLIYGLQKKMEGQRIESPPWDDKTKPMQTFNEIKEGIGAYFKLMGIVNSAKITPSEAKGELKSLFNKFISMMIKNGGEDKGSPEEEKTNEADAVKEDVLGSKKEMTGEIILNN
jgi:hypothetical protein